MNTEPPGLSEDFQRLYCSAAVFEGFSELHPVNFTRVLPFQAQDPVADDPSLLTAEALHLANRNDTTRLAVVEAFGQCGLLPAADVASLKPVIDYFDADFFELMGEVYANAGMFICALRWHREFIAELEARRSDMASDKEGVYASVGYCLYSLGLYPEAITWSKSCIGPGQTTDTVNRALIGYEAQSQSGSMLAIERASSRTRYTVSAFAPDQASELTSRLKLAMNTFAPFQDVHVAWVSSETPAPEILPEGYPFQAERDAGTMTRHRMNLIFALCGQADILIARGYSAEAKRLLFEAALFEPRAEFVINRLKVMP
jgi:hypothetical protein